MNDTEMEILQGTISAVVFQNYENGYAVLRLAAQDGNTVTVVGTIPMPSVGEQLMVTGRWGNHSGYGRQFEAEFLERLLPQTESQILAFLSGRAVKGIGPKTAGRIVSRFGAKTLEIMEREPEQLAQVPGISPAKAKAIGEEFRLRTGVRRLMEFFAQHDLDAQLAVRVYRMYGEGATDLLYDDPYLLMEEGLDASFGAVDRFAISLGVAGDDRRRVEAGILFELRYNLTAGHSFLPKEKLAAATAQLLSVDVDTVNAGLDRLAEGERAFRLFICRSWRRRRPIPPCGCCNLPPTIKRLRRIWIKWSALPLRKAALPTPHNRSRPSGTQPPAACWWLPAAPAPARPASSTVFFLFSTRWG